MPLTTPQIDVIRSAALDWSMSRSDALARLFLVAGARYGGPAVLAVVVVGRRSVTVEFVEPADAAAVRDMLDFAAGLLTSGGGAAGRQVLPGRPMAGGEGEVRP